MSQKMPEMIEKIVLKREDNFNIHSWYESSQINHQTQHQQQQSLCAFLMSSWSTTWNSAIY